jgi:transcriptional regulator with XRE-family HTH domain
VTATIPPHRRQLGRQLRTWRDRAGLSTYSLAEQIGIAQPRVSRLEHGKSIARPEEVHKWVLACGGTETEADELARTATAAQSTMTLWRSTEPGGIVEQQQQVEERERSARVIRAFHSAGLYAGLVQTGWYIRCQFELAGSPDVEAGIAARMRRQRLLDDPAHEFEFLFTEPALLWRPGPPQMQIAQLEHLKQVMTLPNVRIGIVPLDVRAPTYYHTGFTLYEDRADDEDPMIEVETIEGERITTDPGIVGRYRQRLDKLRTVALFDDPAVDRIDRAIEQLREQRQLQDTEGNHS